MAPESAEPATGTATSASAAWSTATRRRTTRPVLRSAPDGGNTTAAVRQVLSARDLMTAPAATCTADARLADAAALMRDRRCGALPVVGRDGRIVGIVTDRDLALRAWHLGDPRTLRVGDVMSRGVVCCHAADEADAVAHLMGLHRVRRLPVVDPAGRVLGIVSQADLFTRGRPGLAMEFDDLVRTLEQLSQPTADGRR